MIPATKGSAVIGEKLAGPNHTAPMRFKLEPARSVTGNVVDSSGEPVGGIEVYALTIADLQSKVRGKHLFSLWDSDLSPRATTDDRGRFTLNGLPPNKRILIGTNPHQEFCFTNGYFATTDQPQPDLKDMSISSTETKTQYHQVPTGEITLVVQKGHRVSGEVVLPDGTPTKGLKGKVFRKSSNVPIYFSVDDEGKFKTKSCLLDSTVHVCISPPSDSTLIRSLDDVSFETEGQHKNIRVVLKEGAIVAGSLVTKDGDPIAGATMLMLPDEQPLLPSYVVSWSATTDDAGEFSLRAKPDTKGTLFATKRSADGIDKLVGYDLPSTSAVFGSGYNPDSPETLPSHRREMRFQPSIKINTGAIGQTTKPVQLVLGEYDYAESGGRETPSSSPNSNIPNALRIALMNRKNARWILRREQELLSPAEKLQPLLDQAAEMDREVQRLEQRVINGDKDIDATEPNNPTTITFDVPDTDDEALQLAKQVFAERRQAMSGFFLRYRSISNVGENPPEPLGESSLAYMGDKLLLGKRLDPDSILFDRKRGIVSKPWAENSDPSESDEQLSLRGYFEGVQGALQVSGLFGMSEHEAPFVDELLDASESAEAKWVGDGDDRLLQVEFSYLFESDDAGNFSGFFRATYLLDPSKNYCPIEYRTRTRLGEGVRWKVDTFHAMKVEGIENRIWFPKTMFFESDNPKIYNGCEMLAPLVAASFFNNVNSATPESTESVVLDGSDLQQSVAQVVLGMQDIKIRCRDIIVLACKPHPISEPRVEDLDVSDWLSRYGQSYYWLLDTFELEDREQYVAEFKSLAERCHRLREYQRDLICTATIQASRSKKQDSTVEENPANQQSTKDETSFRPELLTSNSIAQYETEMRSVKLGLDRVYEQLNEWTPFSKLQKKHAAFLEIVSRLPDDEKIKYFAADYRVTRTNIIGAKIADVNSADFGDKGKFERNEKVRWHLPTRQGYVEDDEYLQLKQYHFDGKRHLEVFHHDESLEAIISSEQSERYDWKGLLYCDYVLRPFRGLEDERFPETQFNISLQKLLRGHEKRHHVITDKLFRIVEDSANRLRIDVVQSRWGNLDPGTTYEVTLDKRLNYAIVCIVRRSNNKVDNQGGPNFEQPIFAGTVEQKTFFTDHVQFGNHWIPKRMVEFFDHEGSTDEQEVEEAADDPYRYAGVQKAEYIASYLSINKKEDMIELPIPKGAIVEDQRANNENPKSN